MRARCARNRFHLSGSTLDFTLTQWPHSIGSYRRPSGTYELLEGLEQLRFLENGWTITTVPVPAPDHALSGIDTPEDLALAEDAIAQFGDPFPG